MSPRYFKPVAIIILFGLCASTQADTLTGWVSQVTDGNTITVQDYANQQHKVRLMGIDAPEKYQIYGNRAHQTLGALLNGRDVAVEWHTKDRFGRIIGKVLVTPFDSPCRNQPDCPRTLDAGLAQVKAGQAWWNRNNANEQTPDDRSRYEQAEFDAKVHRNGLWAENNPVPPGMFRRDIK